MHTRLYSATTIGIDAQLIEVEVDLAMGLLKMTIVGLPDKAISESSERIRAALRNSGLVVPPRAITVNLAPAAVRKHNVLFDLPIALAILHAAQLIALSPAYREETVFLGELALDGSVRPVCGVLAIVEYAARLGKKQIIVPAANVAEAALIPGIAVYGVATLAELVLLVTGQLIREPAPVRQFADELTLAVGDDLGDVVGQETAKRALQIAAAGRHNLLFMGPPGAGKTMLAKRLITLLPPLTPTESLQVTKIYSVAGQLTPPGLVVRRPFRAPHHTVSSAGLVGGGSFPRPGEVSLAHAGVLFLDELTEFSRKTLEVLRQPLESGQVLISRAQQGVTFPADCLVVAALNPCPCGYFGDGSTRCRCTPQQVQNYLGKLSGPLLDRIDLQVPVRGVAYHEVTSQRSAPLAAILQREQIARAYAAQRARQQPVATAALQGQQVIAFCPLTADAQIVVGQAFDRLGLSMRGYHKVLKIARTIADLAGEEVIQAAHIKEALSLRVMPN